MATGGYYNPTNENLANQGNLFGTIDGNGTTELSFEMNRFIRIILYIFFYTFSKVFANIWWFFSGSTLFGDNSIIGRTFVIFENAFGQNSDDDDAGAILVCGIIHTENSEKVNRKYIFHYLFYTQLENSIPHQIIHIYFKITL